MSVSRRVAEVADDLQECQLPANTVCGLVRHERRRMRMLRGAPIMTTDHQTALSRLSPHRPIWRARVVFGLQCVGGACVLAVCLAVIFLWLVVIPGLEW
jgi:hypothetical protein